MARLSVSLERTVEEDETHITCVYPVDFDIELTLVEGVAFASANPDLTDDPRLLKQQPLRQLLDRLTDIITENLKE